jgi:hypothetical protein
MSRPLFLIAAIPSLIGVWGHSHIGERDIFPKLSITKNGLNASQLHILRTTWHATSLSFALLASLQVLLGLKTGLLSAAEAWIVTGMSIWYAVLGIASVAYWDRYQPQGWTFLVIAALLQLGLTLTP